MSTADSVKTELAGLLTKANAATGNADTTIHDAVYALVEGYGQGGGGDIDALIDGSITEITSNVTQISTSAFSGRKELTSANFPDATATGTSAFQNCSKLISINFPKAETINQNAFNGCIALKSVDFPKTKTVYNNAFYGCSAITNANFPEATKLYSSAFFNCSALDSINFPELIEIGSDAFRNCKALTNVTLPKVQKTAGATFRGCTALKIADFWAVTSMGAYEFESCSALTAVILRSETGATLSNTNAFNNTPIASGTGYFYVPAAVIDEKYRNGTNWSTYAARFRALEDYTVDGTITGELDPNKI